MDGTFNRRMTGLMAVGLGMLGLARFISYFRSGEVFEAIWGTGMVLVALSIYFGRLFPGPERRHTTLAGRTATVSVYIGLALLLWAVARLLLS